MTIKYGPPIHGNWQIPTSAPSPNAAAKEAFSMSAAIGRFVKDGIESLIGIFGKNRLARLMMPKRMSNDAPSLPMKCGVLKRCSTFNRPSPIKRYDEIG